MANCMQCGNEVKPGEVFCRHCGARLASASPGQGASTAGPVTEEEFAAFVGKNTDKYLDSFHEFAQHGDSFSATWHWPAFFFTFWWLIYRKMYLWLLAFVLLGCVPYVGLLVMIGFGISAKYLYYRHAKKKILELKSQTTSDLDRAAAIARAGGVNNVAVVLVPIVTIAILGILAAIAVPQFVEYRRRAADQKAKEEIQEACNIGAKIFAEHDGRRDTFSISAKHKKGSTLYTTDRECYLTEERQETR